MSTRRPRQIISTRQLRVRWTGVLLNSARSGPAGISHQQDACGTHVIECRDDDGNLQGVLVLHGPDSDYEIPGQLLVMVDPARQRRGIGTALLTEAARRGIEIDYERQCYTRAGWALVRKHFVAKEAA